jgi:RHS repeat-associated protein
MLKNCVRSRFSLRKTIAITLICLMFVFQLPSPTSAAILQTTAQRIGKAVSTLGALTARNIRTNSEKQRVRSSSASPNEEREARVVTVELNVANDLVLRSRQRIILAAIPVDKDGQPIHGLSAVWESSNKQVVFIKPNGQALGGKPGSARLTARVGSKQVTINVNVVNDGAGGKKRVDSTRRPQPQIGAAMPVISGNSGKKSSQMKRAHSNKINVSAIRPFIRDPNDDPLPDNETSSLYQPGNLIGAPAGKKKPGAMSAASAVQVTENGTRNFNFALPIVQLPGRNMAVDLSLVYNSLLWNKSTDPSDSSTWMTYDVDSGYPAPGFRLGYGQIDDQGSAGYTLTEADGTRYALTLSSGGIYETTDGSFIRFIEAGFGGTLFYPDGTRVFYSAAGGGLRSYPTLIIDANGNYIAISYVNNVGPRIYSVQDTVGRYVRFYYDSNNDLVAITQPGLTGQSDLQMIRFYYENVTLPSGLFASGINVDKPSTARVVRYVYMPASAAGNTSSAGDTGYRFDYSQYGMIYQMVKFRGMTASTTSTSSTGTVTEGTNTTAATTTYDYHTTANAISDVPTFAHRTDEWAGRTTGGSPPQYTFAFSEGTSDTTSTITAPDGSVSITKSIKNPASWNDGLVTETRVQNGSGTVFQKTVITWEQNSTNGTPRIANVKFTNEANKTTAQDFTYDSSTAFNNVSVLSERGFTTDGSLGTELRRTETTYVTSSNYLDRRLLHLPSMIKVFPGGSSTPASRVDYAYDNYGSNHANMTPRNNIIMHDLASDPFQELQESCDWECRLWGYTEGGIWDCINWEWVCHFWTNYDPSTDYRGNVTSITTYPDATTTSGAITRELTYDIAGNVMTAQVDCCQVQSFAYSTANNDYAYPISVTKGNPSGLHWTTSTDYDMNTGLVDTETDENTQSTIISYDPETLSVGQVDFPDGGQTSYTYSNALTADSAGRYHSHAVMTKKLDSTRYVDSKMYFDGRGDMTQSFDSYTSTNGWSVVDIEYDAMGRAYRSSNPYYCTTSYGTCSINPSGIWTTETFDVLGRITQVTMPRGDDSSPSATTTMQFTYDGEVATTTDQAGKQRRHVVDALGRTIRLHEPISSGSLGTVSSPHQETTYTYDVLDNLVKITQGSQERFFKYDSLSRLIREKHVEQTTNWAYNLSDSVNSSGTWTRKLEYNSHNLLTAVHDARGVSASFTYDGLHRLTLIDYSDSTPDARYFYDSQTLPSGAPTYTKGSSNNRVIAVTYGTSTSTTGTYFGYDSRGRVNVQKQVTGANTYSLSYSYNLGGLLATETYPTNRVLTHSYDNAGRLSQISDGTTNFASSMSYAASGALLSETWGNAAVHSRSYNNALQLSQIKLKQSSSGSELQRYDYLYGQVTQSTGSVDKSKNNGQIGRTDGFINGSSTKEWEQRFSYDELGRLSTASEYQQGTGGSPTWKQEFSYDRYNNRFQSGSGNTGMSFVSVVSSDITASTNRFISTGSTPVTYDASGNITQDAKFRSMNYTYDANGRQLTAAGIGGSPSQTSTYDCFGQRVQTTSGGVTRTMVYDVFGQLVSDYNGSIVQRENFYRGGQLFAVNEASGGLQYVLSDAQGSTRALMNNSGSGTSTITSRHDYLPFGEEIGAGVGLRTTTQKYSQSDNARARFASMDRDDVTGLDHTLFRKYESRSGRWTSPDPLKGGLSDPQSFNQYSYVTSDPVNLTDPEGLAPCAPGDPSIHCNWGTVSWGFWGQGNLMNRRQARDWALEDKPRALQCPPGQICFLQQLDDKRFKLHTFNVSDLLQVKRKEIVLPDNGPTVRNSEIIRRSQRKDRLEACLLGAKQDYEKRTDPLKADFFNRAYFIDEITQVTTSITALLNGAKEARGLVGKAALKAAGKGALRGIPAAWLANVGYAYARNAPAAYAYWQAYEREKMGCYSRWGGR